MNNLLTDLIKRTHQVEPLAPVIDLTAYTFDEAAGQYGSADLEAILSEHFGLHVVCPYADVLSAIRRMNFNQTYLIRVKQSPNNMVVDTYCKLTASIGVDPIFENFYIAFTSGIKYYRLYSR